MRRHCSPVAMLAVALLGGAATAVGEQVPRLDDVFHRTALIAHVRVAGEMPRAERGEKLWLAEILDVAQGPAAGQLVLIAVDDEDDAAATFKPAAMMILFATREVDGIYRPLDDACGCWAIDRAGKLHSHPLAELLPPTANRSDPADAIAWLWNEARQHDFEISVAIDQRDLRNYESGNRLRLSITIDNLGGRNMSFNNWIEFEYHTPRLARLEEKISESSLECVKVYAQPLAAEHMLAEMQKMLRGESALTLSPGDRCVAELDLSHEPMIYGGMRYQLWAEVGGRQSPPIVFELPGEEAAMELMEKLAEEEGDGPFRIVARDQAERQPMPMVEPTDEAAAINAALSAWLRFDVDSSAVKPSTATPEIVLLGRANLPLEFAGTDDQLHFVVAEPNLRDDEKPLTFALSQEKAGFRGRALRVENVEVAKQTARVELREVSNFRSGALAIVPLRREQAVWRLAGEIILQQH